MTVETLKRVFLYNPSSNKEDVVELPDPNPAFTEDQVLEHYSGVYPEMNNGSIVRDRTSKGDTVIYRIKNTLGTKG